MAEATGGTLTRGEVLDIVRNQLAEILEIDAASITESSSSRTISTPTPWHLSSSWRRWRRN